jgi:hypothetical protein
MFHFYPLTMKRLFIFFAVMFIMAVSPLFTISASAQDFTEDTMLVLKERFKKPFPTVWKTVLKLLEEKGCSIESKKQSQDEQTEAFKGNIKSEACVIATGEDSTRDVLMKYGKVPMIRGGVWISGRIQYNFALKDIPEDKSVQVVLTAQLSGKEDYITQVIHAWNSNGILETKLMEDLKKAIAAIPDKK